MKKERTRTRISIGYYCIPLLFSILLLSTCTGNYLFDDEEPASRLSVSGTVRLGDGLDPSGTFIWLDGLDIHTTADASGNFTLELPPQQSQAGGGLTGDYRLYAYVGNYQFQSYSVVLRDGSIQYGVGDVDTNGRIPEIIVLDKLVDIRTTIEPNTITEIDSLRLLITVSLRLHVNTVRIKTSKSGDWLTSMIFKEINDPPSAATFYGSSTDPITVDVRTNVNWQMGVGAWWLSTRIQRTLPPGVYEVIPYLVILQDGIPDGLFEAIGEYATLYHLDYFNIPIRWTLGRLTITPVGE